MRKRGTFLPRPHPGCLRVARAPVPRWYPKGLHPLPVSLLQAQAQLQESSQKLDLLRLALEQLLGGLPPAHPLRGRVARELRTAMSGNPQPSGTLVKPTAVTGSRKSCLLQASPSLPGRPRKHSGEGFLEKTSHPGFTLPSLCDLVQLTCPLQTSVYQAVKRG